MPSIRVHLKIRIVDRFRGVRVAARSANRRFLFKAAGYVMKAARSSIKGRTKIKRKGASKYGTPVHTGAGKLTKRALRFDVDDKAGNAIIGPRYSIIGASGGAHEHGGRYKKEVYPKGRRARAYMFPALRRTAPRFASIWSGILNKSRK